MQRRPAGEKQRGQEGQRRYDRVSGLRERQPGKHRSYTSFISVKAGTYKCTFYKKACNYIMELINLLCDCVGACDSLPSLQLSFLSYHLGSDQENPTVWATKPDVNFTHIEDHLRKVQQQSDLLELFCFVLFETTGKAVYLPERLVIAIKWRPGRCYRVGEK